MKPIAIIGGGIAGLGAALVFRQARMPFLIIEARDEPGGRMASLHGDGWVADAGCPTFSLGDSSLMKLIREVGLDIETPAVMDAVGRLDESGKVNSSGRSFGRNLVSLRRGMGSLFDTWRHHVPFMLSTAIGALKWDDHQKVFLMRDSHTARAVRNPIDQRVVESPGVVLAIPGTAAQSIVRSSRFLAPIEKYFDHIAYKDRVVGIYRVPRMDPGFAILHGNSQSSFEWLCFEERKHPDRAPADWSIITAWASPRMMETRDARFELGALEKLYAGIRDVISGLPAEPAEQHLVRWTAAHPHSGSILQVTPEGIPTEPPGLPFALAGDYTLGDSADAAAESGMRAANQVLARLRH